jgi:hypothetical protein
LGTAGLDSVAVGEVDHKIPIHNKGNLNGYREKFGAGSTGTAHRRGQDNHTISKRKILI